MNCGQWTAEQGSCCATIPLKGTRKISFTEACSCRKATCGRRCALRLKELGVVNVKREGMAGCRGGRSRGARHGGAGFLRRKAFAKAVVLKLHDLLGKDEEFNENSRALRGRVRTSLC